MKRKYISRVLISLCFAISLSIVLCPKAAAAEIYPATPIKWASYTNSSALNRSMTIRWYNYNVVNSNWTSQFNSAFSSYWGTQYGVSVTRATNGNNLTALITFVTPASSLWETKLASMSYTSGSVAAITYPFDTNGKEISSAATASSSTRKIRSARIELNPRSNASILSGVTASGYRAILAHEVGHALGFGHYWSSPNLMYSAVSNIVTITSLTTYDKNEFARKYYGNP